jgi:hypothetical protein
MLRRTGATWCKITVSLQDRYDTHCLGLWIVSISGKLRKMTPKRITSTGIYYARGLTCAGQFCALAFVSSLMVSPRQAVGGWSETAAGAVVDLLCAGVDFLTRVSSTDRDTLHHGTSRRTCTRRVEGVYHRQSTHWIGQNVVSGANMNFDRLRFVAKCTALGERREALLSVDIPEHPHAHCCRLRRA